MNLIDLPNELLELIVRSCRISTDAALLYCQEEDPQMIKFTDLRALSQTCKILYKIATPILYQIICVTSDEAMARLRGTLCAKPELAQHPQIVSIDYGTDDSHHMKIGFLEDLPNVKHLFMSMMGFDYDTDDEDENGDIESGRLWRKVISPPLPGAVAPLSSLDSCKSLDVPFYRYINIY